MIRVFPAFALLIAVALPARADLVTYKLIVDDVDGTLGANTFTDATVTMTGVGDTSNITGTGSNRVLDLSSLTVDVTGFSTATFTGATNVLIGSVSGSLAFRPGLGEILGITSTDLVGYLLATSISPSVSGTGISGEVSADTTLGVFQVTGFADTPPAQLSARLYNPFPSRRRFGSPRSGAWSCCPPPAFGTATIASPQKHPPGGQPRFCVFGRAWGPSRRSQRPSPPYAPPCCLSHDSWGLARATSQIPDRLRGPATALPVLFSRGCGGIVQPGVSTPGPCDGAAGALQPRMRRHRTARRVNAGAL